VSPEATPPETRIDPPFAGDERATLDGFLDYHRETLLWKCGGLTEEQLKQHAIRSSNLTLLGLVRHMAEVERGWFSSFTGTDKTWLFCTEDDTDGDFDNVGTADVEHDFMIYRTEIDTYRRELENIDLDAVFVQERRNRTISLRWVVAHLIEEYARHNGHADLLREAIDGMTGE
jgi:uncharacterized damage-inducible protein DinB